MWLNNVTLVFLTLLVSHCWSKKHVFETINELGKHYSEKERVIEGNILQDRHSHSEHECVDFCYRHSHCQAYNFNFRLDNSGKFKCQLVHEIGYQLRTSAKGGWLYGIVNKECFQKILTPDACWSRDVRADRPSPTCSRFAKQCRVTFNYEDIGCYVDKRDARALPIFVAGRTIAWNNLNKTAKKIVERCAQLVARNKDWEYFGVQYGGECWSGPDAGAVSNAYDQHGNSSRCHKGIGGEYSNFVYRLLL